MSDTIKKYYDDNELDYIQQSQVLALKESIRENIYFFHWFEKRRYYSDANYNLSNIIRDFKKLYRITPIIARVMYQNEISDDLKRFVLLPGSY